MRYKLLSLSAGMLFAAVFINSCKQGLNATDVMPMKTSAGGSLSPAKPALTYCTEIIQQRRNYTTIVVMDTDGTHAANIYISPNPTNSGATYSLAGSPCWSPTGASIAFIEQTVSSSSNTWSIKAVDVSVNSRGVAVGSNVRTLFNTTEQIIDIAWCSASGTGRIAFTAQHSTGIDMISEVYTMAQTGGTPTAIVTQSNILFASPTWNADDSKLAVISKVVGQKSGHLLILNRTDGSVLEDNNLTSIFSIVGSEWARTGNTIAFTGKSDSLASQVTYYIDYSSGTGAYTQGAVGIQPTWSPNNATIIMSDPSNGNVLKINAFGSSESTIATGAGWPVQWKP